MLDCHSGDSAGYLLRGAFGLLLRIEGKAVFVGTAYRADPSVWDFVEGCAGFDAAVGVAFFGIVDVVANIADVFVHKAEY